MAEYNDDEPGTAQRVVGESNITALRREAENPLCSTKTKKSPKGGFFVLNHWYRSKGSRGMSGIATFYAGRAVEAQNIAARLGLAR